MNKAKSSIKASVLAALLVLCFAAITSAFAQDVGMTGKPVVKIGMIAPDESPNEAQLLALQAPSATVRYYNNNSSQRTALVISAFGGNANAAGLFAKWGEEKQMGRVFGNPYPSDKPVMKGAEQEIADHYFDRGNM